MGKDELKDGELISMLRLRGIKPSQIFKAEEIFEDENFKKRIQSEVNYQQYVKEQEVNEETNKELEIERKIEEDKLKEDNELIPGPDPTEKEPEKDDKKKKKDEKKANEENDMIPDPDVDDKGEPGNSDDMIPD